MQRLGKRIKSARTPVYPTLTPNTYLSHDAAPEPPFVRTITAARKMDGATIEQRRRRSPGCLRSSVSVADELVAPALQPHTHNPKDQRERKHNRIPINHRVRHSRRQRPVLPAPEGHQRTDDQGLKAEHQKKLAAPPPL